MMFGQKRQCDNFRANEKEVIESTKIYSIAGELSENKPIIDTPPFRAPHHTSTPVAINRWKVKK